MKGLPISFVSVSTISIDQSSTLGMSIYPILVDRDTFVKEALSSGVQGVKVLVPSILGEMAIGKVIQFNLGKKHVAPTPTIQVLSLLKITTDYQRLYLQIAKVFIQRGPPPSQRKLLCIMGAYKWKAQRFLPKDVPQEDREGLGGEFNQKAPILEKEAIFLVD